MYMNPLRTDLLVVEVEQAYLFANAWQCYLNSLETCVYVYLFDMYVGPHLLQHVGAHTRDMYTFWMNMRSVYTCKCVYIYTHTYVPWNRTWQHVGAHMREQTAYPAIFSKKRQEAEGRLRAKIHGCCRMNTTQARTRKRTPHLHTHTHTRHKQYLELVLCNTSAFMRDIKQHFQRSIIHSPHRLVA